MRIAILCALLVAASAPAQYIPSGVHLKSDSRKIEDLEWEKAKRTREAEPLQSFVSRFPKSRHVKAAERLLTTLARSERNRSTEDAPTYTLIPVGKDVVRAVPVN